MNTSRLVWGVICLVLAAALGVLCIVLPPENLTFQIGDQNLPWVPAVALGIIGIWLLARVGGSRPAAAEGKRLDVVPNPEKVALNKRLENIGWVLFLIMWGGSELVSSKTISEGWWSIGVGLIMLGLNVARYRYQIRMSGFTTVLGVLSVIGGVVQLLGMRDMDGAMLLIILGAYLIFKPWFDERKLFGKAEES